MYENEKVFEGHKYLTTEILFDEWEFGKWFKIGLYDILNKTSLVKKDKANYYMFYAQVGENNPFRISTKGFIKIHISKAAFDKEVIRHISFMELDNDAIDLTMDICRISKYNIHMKNVVCNSHTTLKANIL